MTPSEEILWESQEYGMRKLEIEICVEQILKSIGEDPKRDGLIETPNRIAKAWLEMTEGYRMDPADVFKIFEVDTASDSMVIVAGIPFHSLCEHHGLPFHGTADIGYIPNNKVLGLSKFARLVDIFAHRLQVQERLTQEVLDSINKYLDPVGAIVVMQAVHLCMEARGVRKSGTTTITSALSGVFRTVPAARAEFLALRGSK